MKEITNFLLRLLESCQTPVAEGFFLRHATIVCGESLVCHECDKLVQEADSLWDDSILSGNPRLSALRQSPFPQIKHKQLESRSALMMKYKGVCSIFLSVRSSIHVSIFWRSSVTGVAHNHHGLLTKVTLNDILIQLVHDSEVVEGDSQLGNTYLQNINQMCQHDDSLFDSMLKCPNHMANIVGGVLNG